MGFERPHVTTAAEADRVFLDALEIQFRELNVPPDVAERIRQELDPAKLVLSDRPEYDAEIYVKKETGKLTDLEMEKINERRALENQAAEAAE